MDLSSIPSLAYLVVERGHGLSHWDARSPARSGGWRPAVDLGYGAILKRYRGFEGTPWPQYPDPEPFHNTRGLAAECDLSSVVEYFESVRHQQNVIDLIGLAPAEPAVVGVLPGRFELLGFDYGHGLEDDYRCSLLYHEVLFGLEDELRAFGRLLNTNLLLPELALAYELDITRQRLLDGRALIEMTGGDDPTAVVAVFGELFDR